MGYRKYLLSGGLLTKEDLQNIFSEVLSLLNCIGIEIRHPESLSSLARKEGIRVRDSRIFYSNDLLFLAPSRI